MDIKTAMEADRYQKNHKVFIIGLISLLIGLSGLALTLYLLPHLLFGWHYDTPEFIVFWRHWLQSEQGFTEAAASKLVLLFFFSLAVIFGAIAYFSSNRIDSEILSAELEAPELPEQSRELKPSTREGLGLGLKILFLMAIIFMLAALLEWAIHIT